MAKSMKTLEDLIKSGPNKLKLKRFEKENLDNRITEYYRNFDPDKLIVDYLPWNCKVGVSVYEVENLIFLTELSNPEQFNFERGYGDVIINLLKKHIIINENNWRSLKIIHHTETDNGFYPWANLFVLRDDLGSSRSICSNEIQIVGVDTHFQYIIREQNNFGCLEID